MPVSYFPLFLTAALVGIPFFVAVHKGRKAGSVTLGVSIVLFALIVIPVYVEGILLRRQASLGSPKNQYRYAQWLESHCDRIGNWILWGSPPSNPSAGYRWLQKAAAQDYPPAVWFVGFRLKYGIGVPRPEMWDGSAGNCFPQPEAGQKLMDHAVKDLGFGAPRPEIGAYTRYLRGAEPR